MDKSLYNHRKNECQLALVQERSDRFCIADEGYFYRTREGEMRGPFRSFVEANLDLYQFVEIVSGKLSNRRVA